jgi:hypothetical protein
MPENDGFDGVPTLAKTPARAGRIPTEIGRLSQLMRLGVSNNHLAGACPKNSLHMFLRLVYEYSSADTRSVKYVVAGRIPTELGCCSAMSDLELLTNELTGTRIFAPRAAQVWFLILNLRWTNVHSNALQVE